MRLYVLLEQDVLRLQVAMYELGLSEQCQTIDELLRKHAHQGGRQSAELVLLDQFIEVDAQELKHKTQMLPVDKGILEPQQVVVIVLVHLLIQLCPVSTAQCVLGRNTHQVKYRYFHHTLIEVCCAVLDHLDRHHLLRLQVLALDDLAKRSLAQHIENQVAVLVSRLFRSQDVVDIENVIAVLVVVTVVLDSFAGLGENTARIARGLVVESAVAQLVRHGQMGGQRLQGLWGRVSTFRLVRSRLDIH